jgi:putative transposase
MRFSFMKSYQGALSIERLARALKVTSRGFRAWLCRKPCRREQTDEALLVHIKEEHRASLGSYGRPRMTAELRDLGLVVGERRIGRLMRQNALNAVRTRRYKRTTDSNHSFGFSENLLGQDFSADAPNEKWASDISYIWTQEGWLYLAVILDLHSRRVIGWSISDRMKRNLAIQALNMAITNRSPPRGVTHHSDRGSQYCSNDYQRLLKHHGFQSSMSGKGNCYDNAAVETFFKTLKAELIWRKVWQTRQQVHSALFNYINTFYNPKRRHSFLGGLSPIQFERHAA